MNILIAGLSKTGTTGLQYLIANSVDADVKPELLFEPNACPARIKKGNANNVIAKVLIGPSLNAPSFAHFDKKITILRDPRDRIVSVLLYSQFHEDYLKDAERVRVVREILEAKEMCPSSVSIVEILKVIGKVNGKSNTVANFRQKIRKSTEWYDNYVAQMPESLLYKYEDFVSDVYEPLENYLGISLMGDAKVPAKLSRVERTKSYGDWRNWFTAEDVQEFQPLLVPWLEKNGYDANDWLLNLEQVIRPEHCSEYFMRLVEQAKKFSIPPVGSNVAERVKYKIGRIDSDVVSGWAIGADPSKPVQLALLINGKEIAKTISNLPRPGLKAKGLHPTGKCGFAFRLSAVYALQKEDKVEVKSIVG